jgi:hypothetical protein
VIGCALDLDEEDRLSRRQAEVRLPALERFHRAAIKQLRRRRQQTRREEIVERRDGVLERRVPREHDAARRWPWLYAEAESRDDPERALGADEELREVDPAG